MECGSDWSLFGLCVERKVNPSLFLTLLTFSAAYLIAEYVKWRERRRIVRKFLIALVQEIKLNVLILEEGIRDFPAQHELADFLAKAKTNRPYVTYDYLSTIFRSRTEVIQDLEDIFIKNLIDFYGSLERLAGNSNSIERKSFETISDIGRDNVFLDLRRALETTLVKGRSIDDAITLKLRPRRTWSQIRTIVDMSVTSSVSRFIYINPQQKTRLPLHDRDAVHALEVVRVDRAALARDDDAPVLHHPHGDAADLGHEPAPGLGPVARERPRGLRRADGLGLPPRGREVQDGGLDPLRGDLVG